MSQSIRWPQYVAGLSAAGGAIGIGTSLGWSAPAKPRLVEQQQYFDITASQFDWVASIFTLGAAISCLPVGFLMKRFGRKWTMLSLVIPFTLGWSLVAWAQNFWMLFIGRLVIGLSGGAFCIAAPQYSAEIAEKQIRGTIASFLQLLIIVGVVFVYIIGSFMTVFWTNIVCLIIPLVFGVIFVFMPESPVYLIIENREEEALKSYKWLRGSDYDPSSEVSELKDQLIKDQKDQISLREAFLKPESIRAVIIGFSIMFFQQASGINIVILYSTVIFKAANTGIDSDTSTIILGAVHVLATFTSSLLVDKLGRKILLFISGSVMTVMLVALGAFFYIQDNQPDITSSIGWLPITSLCVYIIAFAMGFGPIPWVLASEVYSKAISPIAAPVSGFFCWTLAFLVTATFGYISDGIGIGETFWIFAGLSVLGVLFISFVVPETKGKSIAEIQQMLRGEKIVKSIRINQNKF